MLSSRLTHTHTHTHTVSYSSDESVEKENTVNQKARSVSPQKKQHKKSPNFLETCQALRLRWTIYHNAHYTFPMQTDNLRLNLLSLVTSVPFDKV